MPKRKLTYQDFINYFKNHLQSKDKHAFEKKMMQDAFDEEAFDGLSKLSQSELENDVAGLKTNIQNRARKSTTILPVWFKYAASIIVIVGIGFSIYFLNSNYWQDSMLKEQVAREMDLADSIMVEAEKLIVLSQKDSLKGTDMKGIIAENKPAKKEKKQIKKEQAVTIEIAESDFDSANKMIVDDEDLVIQEAEVMEFEEAELVDDQPGKIATQEKAAVESPLNKKKLSESPNIRIRGASTPTESKSPLYVIDGKPLDLSKTKTIRGKVFSAEDQESIPGVSVQLKDLTVFNTLTDSNGEFSLTIPDEDGLKSLIASFVGMETVQIALDEDTSLMVYMETQTMALDEVVVSGGYEETKQDEPFGRDAQPPLAVSLNKYKKQITEALDYSKFTNLKGKYRIKVRFTVNADGTLSHFQFKNVPDNVLSDEIIRVMEQLGNWLPKVEHNRSVSSAKEFTLRIEIE
jgi:hypothetical protein